MKKIYTLILELINQIKNKTRFRNSMEMEAYGMKIEGQGHMIDGYSSIDHQSFYNSLSKEIEYIKKFKNKDNVTVVDGGANLGFYSIVYSLLDNVSVLSFEPFPDTFAYLKKNINTNKISNITPIEVGLFSETKEMAIGSPNAFRFYSFMTKFFKFTDKDQAGCASVFTSDMSAPIAKFIKGDECHELKSLDSIDLIKIDVEGSELYALQGLEQTILQHQPLLIIEFSIHALLAANISPDKLWNFIKKLGYKKYSLCGGEYQEEDWNTMESMPEIKGAVDYFFSF